MVLRLRTRLLRVLQVLLDDIARILERQRHDLRTILPESLQAFSRDDLAFKNRSSFESFTGWIGEGIWVIARRIDSC